MKKKINDFYDIVSEKEFGSLPGNLAYSFFLSIIPIITLIFFFLTSFNLPFNILLQFLESTFPSGVVSLLQPAFSDEISFHSFLVLLLSIWVSSGGCRAIIFTSNTIYGFKNSHFIKRYIKAFFLAIILIILFAFVLIVPLFGESILNLLASVFPYIKYNQILFDILYFILRIPVSFVVIFFFIKMLYTLSPDERISSKYTNKGALFTTIAWVIVTALYSYYINNIANYNLVYGNLSNIVILLLWFYVLAYVFVIGMYVNKTYNDFGIEKTNQIKLDEIRNRIKEDKKYVKK